MFFFCGVKSFVAIELAGETRPRCHCSSFFVTRLEGRDDLLPAPANVRAANDDCIILIVNAISRAEFDEFTTRFYEDTERTVRDRLPPPFSLALSLSLYLSLFASRNVDLCPTLPLPMDLHPDIYYSQYYRARLYCVSRNAFTSKRLRPSSLFPPLSFCSFLFPPRSDPFASCHARCDLPGLISVVILRRIFIER